MYAGFAVGSGTLPTGVTTSFDATKGVLIKADKTVDARSINALPNGCYYDTMTLELAVTGGTPTSVTYKLSWDSVGDHVFHTASVSVGAMITTTTVDHANAAMGIYRTRPSIGTDGQIYLWLKTDTGTVTVNAVRLDWREKA